MLRKLFKRNTVPLQYNGLNKAYPCWPFPGQTLSGFTKTMWECVTFSDDYQLTIGANIDVTNKGGYTALQLAINFSKPGMCEQLLKAGAQQDIPNHRSTIFDYALERVCNINVGPDRDNAIKSDNAIKCVKIIHNFNKTPLSFAKLKNVIKRLQFMEGNIYIQLLEFLMDGAKGAVDSFQPPVGGAGGHRGAQAPCIDTNGENLLFETHSPTIVDFLLHRGVSASLARNDGLTPLMHHIIAGSSDICKLLIPRVAVDNQINACDNKNCSALFYAISTGSHQNCIELIKQLLAVGAQPNNAIVARALENFEDNALGIVRLLVENKKSPIVLNDAIIAAAMKTEYPKKMLPNLIKLFSENKLIKPFEMSDTIEKLCKWGLYSSVQLLLDAGVTVSQNIVNKYPYLAHWFEMIALRETVKAQEADLQTLLCSPYPGTVFNKVMQQLEKNGQNLTITYNDEACSGLRPCDTYPFILMGQHAPLTPADTYE